jgi:hypothetical protein
MHILLIADGRSPITRRWIASIRALNYRISLLSSYPCDPLEGVERLDVLPLAFSRLASQGSKPASLQAQPGSGRRPRILSTSYRLLLTTRYFIGPLSVSAAASRYRRLLAELKPDLVHALRVPFEGMLASYTPPGIPLAVSIWGNDLTLHAPTSPGMRSLTRRTLQRADGLLTDVQRDQRLACAWGFQSGRPAEVVPGSGGIDLAALQQEIQPLPPGLEAMLPAGLPLVINPRGVRAYARTDTFFRSIPLILERRPDTGFVCPAMADQPQAHAWFERLKLDQRTVLLPILPQGQLWGLFRRSFAAASITTHDGTPNTLLEAMACGSFPIAGDIESLREWIEPGVNGLLVDPGDPAGLAAAVIHALDHPDLRKGAAEKNLALIAERAEISIVRRIVDRFYQTLAALR